MASPHLYSPIPKDPDAPLIDSVTIYSLLSTVAILTAATVASYSYLPSSSTTKTRILFVWHAFDGLIHFTLEAGFVYNCFFSYEEVSALWANMTPFVTHTAPHVHFMNRHDRVYGPQYGKGPLGALWREYGKADARWSGVDLNILSLELLTVFVMAPLGWTVCARLAKGKIDAYFWMIVVATGELYGGFMTFAPEWLSGNQNLDSSNPLWLWVYLVFFNMIWVVIPGWVLYESYYKITAQYPKKTQ